MRLPAHYIEIAAAASFVSGGGQLNWRLACSALSRIYGAARAAPNWVDAEWPLLMPRVPLLVSGCAEPTIERARLARVSYACRHYHPLHHRARRALRAIRAADAVCLAERDAAGEDIYVAILRRAGLPRNDAVEWLRAHD